MNSSYSWVEDHSTVPPGCGTSATTLDLVDCVCSAFGLLSLEPQIKACRAAGEAAGVVNVAVVGRFKAGKSSFLNQILGRDLMPVDVLPATAVVTQMTYGAHDRAVVHYRDASSEPIPLERLPEFVTERLNPDNVKNVDLVDLELVCLAPYRGIRFVDTPGLGSVYAHNTRTSIDWLPKIGAALLAISLDSPLSEEDLRLLVDLERYTPEILILLTRTDLATADQMDAVTTFIRDQVHTRLGREVRVLPFSIKPGFGSLRHAVQTYLREEMAGHHEQKSREILDHKLRALVASCRGYLGLALAAAESDDRAREQLQAMLQTERREFGRVKNETWLLANDLKVRLRGASSERFRAMQPEVLAGLRLEFVGASAGWRGNLAKTSVAFRGWLEQAMTDDLAGISWRGDEFLAGYLQEAESALLRVVRAFQDRVAREIERALGMTFSGAEFHATVREPQVPDVHVDETFDIPLDMLWFLIPMPLFRPLVFRHLRGRLPWETEKNLSRLSVQWADALAASIDEIADQAQGFIQQELETVERLVAESDNRVADLQVALRRLESAATIATNLTGFSPCSAMVTK